MSEEEEGRKYRAPALEKGLDLLELLSAHGRPLTPSQMSAELGRSVSELFRMIQVLEFRGYIEASPHGYRLTNRLFMLGMAQAPVKSLTDAALPHMRALAETTGQSCHLVVPTDLQIVVIARIESPGDLGYSVRVGYRRDLIEATSGLMFYGAASEDRRTALRTGLAEKFGQERTAAFISAAEIAGAAGCAERASDFVEGVTDLVAPILVADGVVATLIVPFIERRPPVCDRPAAMRRLRSTVAAISDELGPSSQT